ncbi:uncharacterized protein LOC130719399 [Lotus japonicus]|uniref:uncharacterized protein LOC130719399 n=1 Tax=Lotus japonicus TaxID=34305 RepID=UPI002590D8D4|nr:uncharacterized protein LOC130719399 [Lotus japonicus]
MALDAFSGDSDPMEHLRYFNTKMVIGGATDAVKCRLLPSTFKGMAMQWFIRQPPFSIDNFTNLSTKFLTQFSANKTTKTTMFDLISIHQQPREKLKTYMARFSKMVVQLEEDNPDTNVVQYPPPPRRPPTNVDTNRWCEYHKTLGHTTNNCWNLRREIDRLIKAGHLATTPEATKVTQGDKACNGKVGVLRVDQNAARECYLRSVALYGRKESHRITEIFPQEGFSLDPRDDADDFRPQPLEETQPARVKDKVLKIGSSFMDKKFSRKVGRNMEVYVDDMIVKFARAGDHGDDLKEAFAQLRKYQMKLNPEKCSFGIQGGKFLGFMLTSRGIEVNPDKGKAILEMKSPTSVKEVQRLTGRMAALALVLPMAGDKAAPFFTCLKKNSKFQWTEACEQAFTKLKESLATLLILSKPTPGVPLTLYLAVTEKAVSTVLLQEEGKKQKVTYFVSHTLQGAEL